METRKKELSILIPVYNTVCVDFVRQLQQMAEQTEIDYEIIVADDASLNQQSVEENRLINQIPHCRFIIKEVNTGSAATRNFLATQSHYPWLLFLDCDMQLPDEQFLSRYLVPLPSPVVNGGLRICHDSRLDANLRYRYEKAEEPNHDAAHRQQRPYHSFRSTNFLIERQVMLSVPFDERFHHSGYEDVLFGKQLRQQNVSIAHIDNPVLMSDFEDNAAYVEKIERSLLTLHQFREELRGYSRLLTLAEGIHISIIRHLLALLHSLLGPYMRRNLCGCHPNLTVFKLYRLGYLLTLNNKH